MLCSVCKKNAAVIYLNSIEDGKKVTKGYCLPCSKKQKNSQLNTFFTQMNMSDEDIENMNEQLDELMNDFENMGKDPNILANPIMGMFSNIFNSGVNDYEETGNSFEPKEEKGNVKVANKKTPKKKRALDVFGTNLTKQAQNNEIDTVVGREKELERLIQILNRKTKNNPVLIGEPGVGKTAIAQALALKIANGDVPAKLINHEVYLLDMTSIIAGTQFRGQFESRMKSILEECKNAGNIILVIDEVHSIVGAGDSEGSMSAGNILKPALARGEIQIIGATTLKEYRKYIEKDSALERRFQPIIVDEPSYEETFKILQGIRKHYEDYHKVKLTDEILDYAVYLSTRYIHDRFLPDKAIDIIDEACSKKNLLNKQLAKLESLKIELKEIEKQKQSAIQTDSIEDYQKAADLKTKECNVINQIADLGNIAYVQLEKEDLAKVVELWTKIPLSSIEQQEKQKLLHLEENISKSVIDQDNAVSLISKTIRRKRTGLGQRKHPPSFIFVGPTGVGKTLLSKTLAKELFGTEDSLIRVDMSEYMESHSVSKLIGSPPGYVGFDEAGQLTEKVRRNPYSIILFDEIEKAHQDVFNMMLQILDEGRLTDSQGRTVNFENTIIIMTSNAGSSFKNNSIGFSLGDFKQYENDAISALKEYFKPEFLNRVDEIIVFSPLSQDSLSKIIDIMLEDVISTLEKQEVTLTVSDKAKKLLIQKEYDPKYGARPLRRAIQKYIEDPLAEMILKDELINKKTISIDVNKSNEFVIK